jgi:hypothetical protein
MKPSNHLPEKFLFNAEHVLNKTLKHLDGKVHTA